jgi:hypothetical protein
MPRKSKRKKRIQRRYRVEARLANWELAKRESAVTFEVEEEGELLGTLTVGRGSIAWTPSRGKFRRSFSWRAFAERIHRLRGRE